MIGGGLLSALTTFTSLWEDAGLQMSQEQTENSSVEQKFWSGAERGSFTGPGVEGEIRK